MHHRRAAFGTELRACFGQRAVLWTARHSRLRFLRGIGRLVQRLVQPERRREAFDHPPRLLGLRLGDLVAARAVVVAITRLRIPVGAAHDLPARRALVKVLFNLPPVCLQLLWRQAIHVARVLARHPVGNGTPQQWNTPQYPAHGLFADVLHDLPADVRRAAVLPAALLTIEYGIRSNAIVAHIVARHACWHYSLPLKRFPA